ncbi:MAG TPA: energy transducer TonB [Luteimonas sp.]|jgi:protein TonB|nr:energy transducer TonB [Luteimonas sp.]
MYLSNAYQARPALFRVVALVLVSCAFAGCNKDKGAAAPDAAAGAAATQAAQPAVADKVNAMSADQLRDAAGQALRQQRLYAPGGDNAMEYYLALRDKQPNDPAVSSALTDLMPYALIATEQSISRDDFSEAQRLYALMEKTDAKAPALPRLKQAIADGQAAAAKKAQDEQLAADDQAKRQAEVEKQRIADQQKQQKEATEALAQQQAAAPPPPAPVQRPAPQQQAPAQQAPAQQQAAAAPPPVQAPAQRAANELRPISTPAPQYPRQAARLGRAGTVEVEFTVGTDGSVTSSRVVNASPPRLFDREALQAINRWRFAPVSSPVTSRRTFNFEPQAQ